MVLLMNQTKNITVIKEVASLRRDVGQLRSLLISVVGRDREGAYKPAFVDEILRSASEPAMRRFKDPASFLASLR